MGLLGPFGDNSPHLSRDRAIHISDKLHGLANELTHTEFFNDEEQGNAIAADLQTALESIGDVLTVIARITGQAWRIEK